MFSIPAIIGLLLFIYLRPQALIGDLDKIPFLYLFCGLAVFGFVLDLKLRLLKPIPVPQLVWTLLFMVWVFITIGVRVSGGKAATAAIPMLIAWLLFVLIAHSAQSFRAMQTLAVSVMIFSLALTAFAVHQGLQETRCARLIERGEGDMIPEDRPCELPTDCFGGEAVPGARYMCEHVGLFGTTSLVQRVRYIGVLQDPNELAIALSCGMALMFGFLARKKSALRTLLGAGVTVAILLALVMTKSRGGQLVFLGVLMVYFVMKYRFVGAAVGALAALPMFLLGGRSDSGTDMSTMQRYHAWDDGLNMFQQYPVLGVGKDMFNEHHGRSAHNSYILPASELGLVGFLLWTIVVYLSVKILVTGLRDLRDVPGADVARSWGRALLAAMAGLLIGIMFLSFSYHYVLWIFMGLCGAYYSAIKSHIPTWKVELRLRDVGICLALDLVFLVALSLWLRVKGVR